MEGAAIGGSPIVIQLATAVFQRYDARSKLLAAADDPDFVKESGDCLFMRASIGGAPPPATARVLHSSGTTYATIVKSIHWARDPYPGAEIEHHSIIVRDFGRIFFGELW